MTWVNMTTLKLLIKCFWELKRCVNWKSDTACQFRYDESCNKVWRCQKNWKLFHFQTIQCPEELMRRLMTFVSSWYKTSRKVTLLQFSLMSQHMFWIWHSFYVSWDTYQMDARNICHFANQYLVRQQDNASVFCFLRLHAALALTRKNALQYVVMVHRR